MTAVDPFHIPIPKAFRRDPEVQAWAEYLHRHLHDMWVRSGGGEDNLEQIVDVITGEPDAELPTGSSGDPPGDPIWDGNFQLWVSA